MPMTCLPGQCHIKQGLLMKLTKLNLHATGSFNGDDRNVLSTIYRSRVEVWFQCPVAKSSLLSIQSIYLCCSICKMEIIMSPHGADARPHKIISADELALRKWSINISTYYTLRGRPCCYHNFAISTVQNFVEN